MVVFIKEHYFFSTCGYTKDELLILNELLKDIGIESSITKHKRLYISRYSLYDFFYYIGKCPNELIGIYDYKWINDEEMHKYKLMKKMKQIYGKNYWHSNRYTIDCKIE